MAAQEDGEDKGVNKHGVPRGPRGFHFAPEDLELLDILDDKLRGRPLDRAYDAVFHEVRILDFHPATLYETYAEDDKDGCIYFFSTRELRTPGGKKKKPLRAAQGGRWKTVKSDNVGSVSVGGKLSMEFYEGRFDGDSDPVRTNWGLQEFVRIIGPKEISGLAVYRLYKIMRNGEEKPDDLAADGAESMNQRGQASAAAMALPPWEMGRRYAYGAAAAPMPSISWAPPSALGPVWWAPPSAPGPLWWAPPTVPAPFWLAPPTVPVPLWWAPPPLPPPSAPGPLYRWASLSATSSPSRPVPPSAPGHYGDFASTDSVAASKLGHKGKAKMTSTDHAGPTSTSAPPAANYQPPPPQGTEHILGSGVVVGHEDDRQQGPVAMLTNEEGYLMVDERNMWCNTQQASSSASAMTASAVLDHPAY